MEPIRKPFAATLLGLLVAFLAATPAAAARTADGDAGDRLSRIEQTLWDRDPHAAPQLREWAANDPDDRVRERAVGALALLRDPEAVPVVLALLDRDPSAAVRRAAAEAVGLLRPSGDVRRLPDRLRKDPDPIVRAECARAIGRLGHRSSLPVLLIAVLNDRSPEVRALAAGALAALASADAADVLRAVAQRDDSVLVRIYAVRALAEIAPAASVSLFQAVWDGSTDPDLRLEAFRGLLLAEGGTSWERTGLADADERVRFLAFRSWLDRTREIHARNLGPKPDRDFETRLEGFLADRVRGIRELAKEQLEALGYRIRPSGFGYAVEP